jgi:DNA-binding NarL/FixJ family response regulator
MMKVVIADDHSIMRIGLRQILSTLDDLAVVDEVASGPEVLIRLRASPAGLLIFGMSTPDLKGIDLIRRVHAEHPSLPILVFGIHNDTQIVSRALRAGSTTSYVKRSSEPNVLLRAVHTVIRGGRFIDPSLANALIFSRHTEETPSQEVLSNRELQVLRMLAAGKRVSEVANELALSAKTVSTHKIRIMKKLDLGNSTALVRYALEYGLYSI